jgi:hypothetical protein
MKIELRAGWESIVIGPRADFGSFLSVRGGALGLTSDAEIERRLAIALRDPANAERFRRGVERWFGEAPRLLRINEAALISRVARMARHGALVAFVVPDIKMKARRIDVATPMISAAPTHSDIAMMTPRERMIVAFAQTPEKIGDIAGRDAREFFAPLVDTLAIGGVVNVVMTLIAASLESQFNLPDWTLDFALREPTAEFNATKFSVGMSLFVIAYHAALNAKTESDIGEVAAQMAQALLAIGLKPARAMLLRGASAAAATWKKQRGAGDFRMKPRNAER